MPILRSLYLFRFSSPPRVLEIIKDSKGFGFVVAGDKPVFIQSVREGKCNILNAIFSIKHRKNNKGTGCKSDPCC